MPALRRYAVLLTLLGLAATLTSVPTMATARETAAGTVIDASVAIVAKKPNRGFTPPSGALLSDPRSPAASG